MNRQVKHVQARAAVTRRLRRMGIEVHESPQAAPYDLLVNRETRVALRVAYPGRYVHRVKVAGKRYIYDYLSWNFNFHRHGKWEERYCDVFVCIAKQRRSADEIFVIPAAAITGPTFSLHGAGKTYRGRYAKYRNRWSILSAGHPNEETAAEVA